MPEQHEGVVLNWLSRNGIWHYELLSECLYLGVPVFIKTLQATRMLFCQYGAKQVIVTVVQERRAPLRREELRLLLGVDSNGNPGPLSERIAKRWIFRWKGSEEDAG